MAVLVNAPGSSGARMTLHSCPVCVQAKSLQSCLTLCRPIDYSPPGSSIHGILQTRILEWAVMPPSKGSSWPRDQTRVSSVSCIGRQVLYHQHHLGSHSCPSWLGQNGRTFVFSHQWFWGSPGHIERPCVRVPVKSPAKVPANSPHPPTYTWMRKPQSLGGWSPVSPNTVRDNNEVQTTAPCYAVEVVCYTAAGSQNIEEPSPRGWSRSISTSSSQKHLIFLSSDLTIISKFRSQFPSRDFTSFKLRS